MAVTFLLDPYLQDLVVNLLFDQVSQVKQLAFTQSAAPSIPWLISWLSFSSSFSLGSTAVAIQEQLLTPQLSGLRQPSRSNCRLLPLLCHLKVQVSQLLAGLIFFRFRKLKKNQSQAQGFMSYSQSKALRFILNWDAPKDYSRDTLVCLETYPKHRGSHQLH